MQFKSSVSKEEYLKRINGETVSKKQETSEEIKKEKQSDQFDWDGLFQSLNTEKDNSKEHRVIDADYKETEIANETKDTETVQEEEKTVPEENRLGRFAKQIFSTKHGKVTVYADDLVEKHYDGKRGAKRTFALAVGSLATFLFISTDWIRALSFISTCGSTYCLLKKYEMVDRDNTCDMLNYVVQHENQKKLTR